MRRRSRPARGAAGAAEAPQGSVEKAKTGTIPAAEKTELAMNPEVCPFCGAAASSDPLGGIRCGACGSVVAEPLSVCPRCRHVNESGAAECARCSTELTAVCPGCRRENWAGAERCAECGRELDVLGHAFRSVERSARIRREELLRRVPGLKEQEECESRQRLEMLREIDLRRMNRAAERAERAKQREQRIIRGAVIAGCIFLILLVVLALFSR